MTIRYKFGSIAQIEDLHQKARTQYLIAFAVAFPESTTRLAINYEDRKTGVVGNVIIQLPTDGKLEDSDDRYDDFIKDAAVPGKALLSYDDAEISN